MVVRRVRVVVWWMGMVRRVRVVRRVGVWVVMGVAEMRRRGREDVGEVGEEEQRREPDEEELRAVHGGGRPAFAADAFALASPVSTPFDTRSWG